MKKLSLNQLENINGGVDVNIDWCDFWGSIVIHSTDFDVAWAAYQNFKAFGCFG